MKMYFEHQRHMTPSPPMHAQKINPLVLSSPHATGYRRQDSTSSTISSIIMISSGSEGLTYSPPSSPTSSSISLDNDYSKDARTRERRGEGGEVDLYQRALLLLDLLYNTNQSPTVAAPAASLTDLIHPSCIFEVEHLNKTASTITSRDSYLQSLSAKLYSTSTRRLGSKVRECVVDDAQRKVWVVSELTYTTPSLSEAGTKEKADVVRKESIDMLTFDATGRLVRREGWMRRSRSRRRRQEED